jgi:hypothetical protein
MNDTPALLIQFDPETWQITGVFYRTGTDEETKCLREIIARGVKCELVAPVGGHYDA